MKILLAADVMPDPDSGAAGTEYQTIRALRRLGHEVDELWASDLGRRIQHGNLHYIFELPRAYRTAIRKRLGQGPYDVFHVNQSHGYLAARDHLRNRRPGVFVYRSHGLDDRFNAEIQTWTRSMGLPLRPFQKRWIGALIDRAIRRHESLAVRYSSGVIVSSSGDRNYVLQTHGCQADRVACIPQAAPAAFVNRSVPTWDPDRLNRILYVSGFAMWKGPHAAAGAANRLLAASSDLHLTWVCHEQDHERVTALLDSKVRAQVRLLPWLSQERLMQVYDEHGIFLYPALFDGFGKVFLEAMSRGLCVVTTATGGMEDIVRSPHNGMRVGMNDPEGLAEAVRFLRGDPAHAYAMSVAARATALEYTWDRVGRETAAFYERLAALDEKGRKK
jgi:glycosyltransferase involved in cell wall biosynthesis